MEIEKIKNLLQSTNFDDVLLGVEFLAKESDIEVSILKINNKARNVNSDTSFDYALLLNLSNIPLKYEDTYFMREGYYFEIMRTHLYIDTSRIAEKRIARGDNLFSEEL